MMPSPNESEATLAFVPLSEYIALARLGAEMRRAQKKCVKKPAKGKPLEPKTTEARQAERAEEKFDKVILEALKREQQSLPGMEGGGQ